MTLERLPLEVVEKVLLKLPPSDRVEKALTCRSWARLVSSSACLKDVWFHAYDSSMAAFFESQRQYRNLRIFGADLTASSLDLWDRVGSHLHHLEFVRCKFTPDALYSILQRCNKLRSLEINGYSDYVRKPSSDHLLMPSDHTCLNALRDSLRSVQHFRTDLTLSQGVLDLLLSLLPNATSLSLRYAISYNRGFRNPCTLRTNQMLTKLEISSAHLPDEDLINVIRMCAGSLQCLRLHHYFDLTVEACSAIGDCTRLRHLHINSASLFNDSHLEKLVRNAPDLESLELSLTGSITNAGLRHIHTCHKLRHLEIAYPHDENITKAGLCGLGEMTSLQSLDLKGARADVRVLRSISNLRDLRKLDISGSVNSQGFDIICKSFQKLEEIQITCAKLSDRDIVKLRNLQNLKKIVFCFCNRFTDRAFIEGIGHLALEYVYIHDCPVTDVGLVSINSHGGNLRKLSLVHCPKIEDAGLLTLLRREPFVKKLIVDSCIKVTNTMARELENICPRLEYLKFDLTGKDRRRFRDHRPSVFLKSPYGIQ